MAGEEVVEYTADEKMSGSPAIEEESRSVIIVKNCSWKCNIIWNKPLGTFIGTFISEDSIKKPFEIILQYLSEHERIIHTKKPEK